MRVEVNKSEELKKERKIEISIYPENERDVETLREIQTSTALVNAKNHGKLDEDKQEYPVTLSFNV
jgi:hypothetical protein